MMQETRRYHDPSAATDMWWLPQLQLVRLQWHTTPPSGDLGRGPKSVLCTRPREDGVAGHSKCPRRVGPISFRPDLRHQR